MKLDLIKYHEPLTVDEIRFLKKKESVEKKQLYQIIRVFMILSFILPFVVAWIRALWGADQPFSFVHYFLGVGFLLLFSLFGVYWGYYHNLRLVQLDLKYRTKTVEQVFITRKQFMPGHLSYFFYLSSSVRLSIEVSEEDFRQLTPGDSLCIEYTTRSRIYLGYLLGSAHLNAKNM